MKLNKKTLWEGAEGKIGGEGIHGQKTDMLFIW
jgi:hypothetical protein